MSDQKICARCGSKIGVGAPLCWICDTPVSTASDNSLGDEGVGEVTQKQLERLNRLNPKGGHGASMTTKINLFILLSAILFGLASINIYISLIFAISVVTAVVSGGGSHSANLSKHDRSSGESPEKHQEKQQSMPGKALSSFFIITWILLALVFVFFFTCISTARW